MAFFTLVSANASVGPARLRRWLRLLLLTALMPLASVAVHAEGFQVRYANTRLSDQVYVLNAGIDYSFSETALQALNNGVPLTILLEIDVQRKRRWWLDADVAELEQRYRIRFHALSGQYLVRNLNSGALYTYSTLSSALDALGRVRDLPLLDEKLIEPGEKYEVELKAELDIEALPSPLRPLAYITPAWHLGSDWFVCSLKP